MLKVKVVNNTFPELEGEHLKEFPKDRFAVEGTPEADDERKKRAEKKGGKFIVSDAALKTFEARWNRGEIPIVYGRLYRWADPDDLNDKPERVYRYIGMMHQDSMYTFMTASDPSKPSYKQDLSEAINSFVNAGESADVPAESKPPFSSFVFKAVDGDNFLITTGSKGLLLEKRPIQVEFFKKACSRVVDGSPFPKRLSASEMAEIIKTLGIRTGGTLLELEPGDAHLPVVLGFSGVDVTAVSERFPKAGYRRPPSSAAETNVKTHVEQLYEQHYRNVVYNGGRIRMLDSVFEAGLGPGSVDAAILANILDAEGMKEKAHEILVYAYSLLADGGRLLVSAADPKNRKWLSELMETALPRDWKLVKVDDKVPTDREFHQKGPNGTAYKIVKRKEE